MHLEILIIDDEAVTREALADIFRQAGYRVDAWGDALTLGAEGMARRYRVAVVDYHLPNLNGLEVAALLKRSQPDCRVLLISSDPPPGAEIFLESGVVDGFLAKPFSKDAILKAVAQLCSPEPC